MFSRDCNVERARTKPRRALRPVLNGLEDRMVPTGLGLSPTTAAAIVTHAGTSVTATHLVITAQPPKSVTAGASFGLTVKVEDAQGHVDTGYNGTVTLSLAKNPGHAALHGTLTVTVKDGVATFTGLTLDRAAAGYTIKAASGKLTAATSSAVTVKHALATHLVISSEPPADATAGAGFKVTVTAEDAFGNVATGFNGKVTLVLGNNPGHALLHGKLSTSAVDGVATFTGLTLDRAANGYTIRATSVGKGSAATAHFNVKAAAATHLVVTAQPPATVGLNTPFALTVTAEDAFGNVATGFGGDATVALKSNAAKATLGGTLTEKASHGVITFGGLTLNKLGTGFTLQVTSHGLGAVATHAFAIVAKVG